MTTNTVKASENPELVNQLVSQAMAEPETKKNDVIVSTPSDVYVTLPGGYITPTGETVTNVEVRELTGKDEEAIARAQNLGKALLSILYRGTVKIGDEVATEELVDQLLAGDRDSIMLGIYKATFGPTAEVQGFCGGCNEFKPVTVSIDDDIKVRPLVDERSFVIDCKIGEVVVSLPTGFAQKELVNNADKTVSELTTILLEQCVTRINGKPVVSRMQVQNLGINDRKKIGEAINKHNIGPIFEDIAVTCPDCESEVRVPINLGSLFRF
jgi:hypothetical protein